MAITRPASTSCVKITPDLSKSYVEDDPLPDRRSMASCVLLPDGKVLCLNGARMGTYPVILLFHISLPYLGTGGYGKRAWALGQSYADDPVLTPVLYDPAAPAGQRWSSDGFSASTVPRMYHSSALLLADGLPIFLFFIFGLINILFRRFHIRLWLQSQQRLRWT